VGVAVWCYLNLFVIYFTLYFSTSPVLFGIEILTFVWNFK
jgi:hypothetical protein